MSDLDDSVGDVKADIADLQKSIVLSLEESVLEAELELQQLSSMLCSLDAVLSLAAVALEMNFVCPEVVEDDLIVIKNGRHPLQELAVDHFVPNDCFLSGEKNVAVIT
eukprot:gene846-941_t